MHKNTKPEPGPIDYVLRLLDRDSLAEGRMVMRREREPVNVYAAALAHIGLGKVLLGMERLDRGTFEASCLDCGKAFPLHKLEDKLRCELCDWPRCGACSTKTSRCVECEGGPYSKRETARNLRRRMNGAAEQEKASEPEPR